MMYYLKFLSREGTIIREGESSYLANALTIIRKRIFKLQISNFLAARARLFASESSNLKSQI